ncbi:MAG: Putative 3-oxoadipate enol-lactonase [Nitrospira sp.]|nr:MAG: Putative 3-oxoadipate enol-lactonase [Nitrospira sp.]
MFFQTQGIRLAYDDEGSGLPIVFLHAFPLNRSMWAPQISALSTQFRTIAIDLRGHGESDAPLWSFSLNQYADDVAALLDHLNIPQAVLVGLSMGGYVSLAFSRTYGNRLLGLVLADTRAQADIPEGRTGRFHLAQTAYTQGREAVANTMLPKLLGSTSLNHTPHLVEHLRQMIQHNPVSGIVVDLMAMAARPDSVAHLSAISCPTLVVIGDEDHTTPLVDAQVMASHIPNARLAVIPAAGHLSNCEQPELFNDLLRGFVEGLRPNSGRF